MNLLALAAAYVVGAVPIGFLVARAFGVGDIRRHGSGNIGATNVLRTLGRLPAIITLLADIAKGYAAEYVPEYEAPADNGYWAEGVESYDDETSPIPYREDLDSPAYPETDESWDTVPLDPSPVESALHNEVRPMTRGLAAGQGAELSLGW